HSFRREHQLDRKLTERARAKRRDVVRKETESLFQSLDASLVYPAERRNLPQPLIDRGKSGARGVPKLPRALRRRSERGSTLAVVARTEPAPTERQQEIEDLGVVRLAAKLVKASARSKCRTASSCAGCSAGRSPARVTYSSASSASRAPAASPKWCASVASCGPRSWPWTASSTCPIRQ